MQYRRSSIEGGTYFFTVNLNDRNQKLLVENIQLLRNSFQHIKNKFPFYINGIVILPDHIHSIWTLPDNDSEYSKRWRLIKSHFSKHLPKSEQINSSRNNKGERGIWQRRFWEHQIRDEEDYRKHMDYMYFNPVKHGYVCNVIDWPFSSFHKDVEAGIYSKNWGLREPSELEVGEDI